MKVKNRLSALELCAGGGGQALGLEQAGFEHAALLEIDHHCVATLRANRPSWNVVHGDLRDFSAKPFAGIDLLAGGVPCPPFSHAGKQLGEDDERNLFPEAIRLVEESRPRAVMLENVRGLLDPAFENYRNFISSEISKLGYWTDWKLLNASDFAVPQLRPRVVFVAIRKELSEDFCWPEVQKRMPRTVGETLYDLMSERGWRGVEAWKTQAMEIAPTLVGGSKKHGGPDLGPTRARAAWATLGVDGKGLANEAPEPDFEGMPRLTVRMAARIQGFPDSWEFCGGKTAAYRQVGNAFPPPVAAAVGKSLLSAIESRALRNAA